MPKRNDIKKILVIGSGPIVIGQAAEFDYAGTQACQSLKEDSLANTDLIMTHVSLNDGSCEGVKHKRYPVFSVQYHPESSPGPEDSKYLFDNFIDMINNNYGEKNA